MTSSEDDARSQYGGAAYEVAAARLGVEQLPDRAVGMYAVSTSRQDSRTREVILGGSPSCRSLETAGERRSFHGRQRLEELGRVRPHPGQRAPRWPRGARAIARGIGIGIERGRGGFIDRDVSWYRVLHSLRRPVGGDAENAVDACDCPSIVIGTADRCGGGNIREREGRRAAHDERAGERHEPICRSGLGQMIPSRHGRSLSEVGQGAWPLRMTRTLAGCHAPSCSNSVLSQISDAIGCTRECSYRYALAWIP